MERNFLGKHFLSFSFRLPSRAPLVLDNGTKFQQLHKTAVPWKYQEHSHTISWENIGRGKYQEHAHHFMGDIWSEEENLN